MRYITWYEENKQKVYEQTLHRLKPESTRTQDEAFVVEGMNVFRWLPLLTAMSIGTLGFPLFLLIIYLILPLAGFEWFTVMGEKLGGITLIYFAFWGLIGVLPFRNLQKDYSEIHLGEEDEEGVMKFTEKEVDELIKTALAAYQGDEIYNNQVLEERVEALQQDLEKRLEFIGVLKGLIKKFLDALFDIKKQHPSLELEEDIEEAIRAQTPEFVGSITGLSTKEAYDTYFKKQ